MIEQNITVVGAGYVGTSIATLLSTKHNVTIIDTLEHKVRLINDRVSPIKDDGIEEYFATEHLNLKATTDPQIAYRNADYVVIATPTNYDEETHQFDTRSIESVVNAILMWADYFPKAIIIKSTIPVGYTNRLRELSGIGNILFSPEFLREGKALVDNLCPSRIIVGVDKKFDKEHIIKAAIEFANMLNDCALRKVPEEQILITGLEEAESIKLFSNTYLALRVAFFNELDSFASYTNLNSADIIKGISFDPRIGEGYNNPSFGYGGYCLPKDTKQLLTNYVHNEVPQSIMKAIVESNQLRKEVVACEIAEKAMTCGSLFPLIGIYKLAMKAGSDNARQSAVIDVLELLKDYDNYQFVIYEPTSTMQTLNGVRIVTDLEAFKKSCDIIVANRVDDMLDDVLDKVYTRDIFGEN
jgi:UDPglucose 6-dehydrogenase